MDTGPSMGGYDTETGQDPITSHGAAWYPTPKVSPVPCTANKGGETERYVAEANQRERKKKAKNFGMRTRMGLLLFVLDCCSATRNHGKRAPTRRPTYNISESLVRH